MSQKARRIRIEVDAERLRPIDADLVRCPTRAQFSDHSRRTPQIPFEVTDADLLDYWRHESLARRTAVDAMIVSWTRFACLMCLGESGISVSFCEHASVGYLKVSGYLGLSANDEINTSVILV